jgi:hypothetical protein
MRPLPRLNRSRMLTTALGLVALGSLVSILGALIYLYWHGTGGFDFWSGYLTAANHLTHGQSPYNSFLLSGPVPVGNDHGFVYPPTLAWLLIPFLALPQNVASLIWLALQVGSMVLGLVLLLRTIKVPFQPRLVFLLIIALVGFPPFISLCYSGNVTGFIALGMALLLRSALRSETGEDSSGPIGAILTVLKLTPGLVLLPLVIADPRRHLPRALLTGLVFTVPFIFLNPGAWLDFAHIPFNLAAGSSWNTNVLGPATALPYHWSVFLPWTTALHLLTLGLTAALVLAAIGLARQKGGLPAALVAASAAAILPFGEILLYYLAVLLPGLILAYFWAGRPGRAAIILGYLLLWGGLAVSFSLASLGMLVLMFVPVFILCPASLTFGRHTFNFKNKQNKPVVG